LPHAKALALVRDARGTTGSNLAYVQNTVAHLRELRLSDAALEALAREASANAAQRRRRRSPA
jgi:cation transport protein ChaC